MSNREHVTMYLNHRPSPSPFPNDIRDPLAPPPPPDSLYKNRARVFLLSFVSRRCTSDRKSIVARGTPKIKTTRARTRSKLNAKLKTHVLGVNQRRGRLRSASFTNPFSCRSPRHSINCLDFLYSKQSAFTRTTRLSIY